MEIMETPKEIHSFSLRPRGYQEPLIPDRFSKKEVADHLLNAPWLCRASEIGRKLNGSGEAAHVLEEPVELRRSCGQIEVLRSNCRRSRSWRRRRVERMLDPWREVDRWWDEEGQVERTTVRVLLAGGSVVDLSKATSGEWFLTGIVD